MGNHSLFFPIAMERNISVHCGYRCIDSEETEKRLYLLDGFIFE